MSLVTGANLQSVTAPEVLSIPDKRRRGARLLGWLPVLVVFGLFVGAWYFVSYVLLAPDQRFLVPPPQQVVQVAFGNSDNLAELLGALWRTTQVALIGLVLATVIGLVLAIAMSQARWIERSLFPYFVFLQCIPILAMVPLFGFWFGYDTPSRLLVCVLIAIFPIIANTLFGLKGVEPGQHDLFTLHNANRWTRLTKLQFPAALPAIFAGLRISAGLSVIGAVVGDFFFKQGDPGIGILIDVYRARIQSEQLFGAIILASMLGVVVFWLFGFIAQRAIGSWHTDSHSR